MTFPHDYTGVSESGDFSPAPDGDYLLRIMGTTVKKSQKGHPQVNVELEITDGKYVGKKLWHTVTFMPAVTNGEPTPGAGISKHFLHAIGEPYEGKVMVAPERWYGRKFSAYLETEGYTDGKGKPRNKNVIRELHIEETPNQPVTPYAEGAKAAETLNETEEVPF